VATQLFPQFLMSVGPVTSPAITPPTGVSQMVLNITAANVSTLIDAELQMSIDGGTTWRPASAITGAIPNNAKTGAFIGFIEWAADLFARRDGLPLRTTDANTRLRLRATNNSGAAILLGPGSLTLV
jgi:hypothetical protein